MFTPGHEPVRSYAIDVPSADFTVCIAASLRDGSQFSPRRGLALRAVLADEDSARTIVVERREVHGRRGLLLDGQDAAVMIEVGGHVAWAGRVDFDPGTTQLVGESEADRVQGRLRRVVRQQVG